ncbi:DUF2520 domain-containing protein [Schaalia sp. ZJ405]|uniref:Rossmann-like and DUF2520 domain-containing protein n=1 Tax=unclassified Schaalia TaxID=2691889 RepID=UPI0013EDFD35|nr:MULTISPECIES: DUF2520 domain-containing protein [unclassified Schaalia]QPK81037.1 DUF2520 domain-containing protein [Schaalia sp. ZJ405]
MVASPAGRLGIGIIGMGHVGPIIGSALRAAGHTIVAVSASSERSRERADAILPGVPIEEVPSVIEHSEVVILAVPDDQIAPLVSGLAEMGAWRTGHIVIHLSGAHGVSILQPAADRGAIPLAIHPAMTFSGWSADVQRLVGTPFAVTAAAPFLPIAQALVVEMGGEPVVVPESQRTLYHAGLAFGANFLGTLVVQTLRILEQAGIDDPRQYVRPLLTAALDRALTEGLSGVSGPVVRADAGTIARHMRALAADPALTREHDTYDYMTRTLTHMLGDVRRLSPDEATTIRAALLDDTSDDKSQS